MGRILGVVVLAVLIAAGITGYGYYEQNLVVTLPRFPAPAKTVWLDQNWTAAQRDWFHGADQGTLTFGVPYEWLVALEQPEISLGNVGLLTDPAYLDRYGFIPSGAGKLPVGFAHGGPMPQPDGSPWLNPATGRKMASVGLTCAACHTGRFTYHGTEVLIDGGPALTDLGSFRTGLGLSILFTDWFPARFDRFAACVLGAGATPAAKAALRAQMDAAAAGVENINTLQTGVKARSVTEGFGRLDALNRIGNTVFSLDLQKPENYAATSAPVHFPRIWNASWFDWVQYNASIEQPMVRNAGEAMGVSAWVNFTPGKFPVFASTVRVDELTKMEALLAGKQPDAQNGFSGLTAPKWPADILPPIDQGLATKGAVLYKSWCESCHLAPVGSADFWASPQWLPPNQAGERYLHVEPVPITHIGTDPAQATDMANRTVVVPDSLGLGSQKFGPALGVVVQKVVDAWYDGQIPPTPPADRLVMDGNRKNGIQALLAYKVRPLNGIWATPPYLHNGSVPTLYALLSPVDERPKDVYLGGREYDPVDVGYRNDPLPGGFDLDTRVRGNFNGGHEFTNDSSRPGRIGRLLAPEERRALVEYLKTL